MQAWIKLPKASKLGLLGLVVLAAVMALTVSPWAGKKGPEKAGGGGRLSPASLDLDTCGCPTTFGDPECEERTYWSLDKTTDSGPFTNPDGEAFLFDVKVTEGPTSKILSGSGQIVITNSGDQTSSLANVAVLLEDLKPGEGDAPGPSGKNWKVLSVVAESEAAACGGDAVTCDGSFTQSAGSNLVLYECYGMNDIIALPDSVQIPPTADNDGDGYRDEDPVLADPLPNPNANACSVHDNDGDGLFDEDPVDGTDNDGDGAIDEDGPDDDDDGAIDEDGACEDAVVICFDYEFDITGLGIQGSGDGVVPSEDDLRIDLLVTFKAGGKRGGTCGLDVDCDGVLEDGKDERPDEGEGYVRTIQQRHQFDPPDCTPKCQDVTLEDTGAAALDDCVDVTTNTLNELITATGEGTESPYRVEGTVSCRNCVEIADLEGLEQALDPYNPGGETAGTASITVAYPGGDSYFNSTVSNGGDFDGTYDGWCIDTNTTISPGTTYCTEMISSYDPFADDLVNVPYLGTGERTLDLVNWIINQDFTNQAATCVTRNYTFGDIQRAIWDLVNPTSTSGLGTWAQCAADEIRNAALADHAANGPFVPACGQQVAVVFNPCGNTGPDPSPGYQITIYQITVGSTGVPCKTVCDECSTVVTNTATLTCAEDQSLVDGSPASASFVVTCGGAQPPAIVPGDFCTQTQGGWGSKAAGNNTGDLRDANFGTVFPNGICLGDNWDSFTNRASCTDGGSEWSIYLSASQAVEDYLPCKGGGGGCTAAALTADQDDPETTASGNLGTQLTAATLNVAFDFAGIGKLDPQRVPPPYLGDLVYGDCVATNLQGLTVNQVIALANCAISGQTSCTVDSQTFAIEGDVTYSDLNDALSKLNEEFVDCTTVATGCLALPPAPQ